MDEITIQEAVDHVGFLLTSTEKEVLKLRLNEQIHEKNHFYRNSYFSFHYGSLSFSRGNSDGSDLNKNQIHYLKIRLGSPYKDGNPVGYIEELLPVPELNLAEGTLIDTREFYKHKPHYKYSDIKPPVKITKISGNFVTTEFVYTWRKQKYTREEYWSRVNLEKKIYRNVYFIKNK